MMLDLFQHDPMFAVPVMMAVVVLLAVILTRGMGSPPSGRSDYDGGPFV